MDRSDTHETAVTRQLSSLLGRSNKKRSAAVIRAVVRGERPVSDLAGAGLSENDPAGFAETLAGLPMWSSDLAEGIMRLKGDLAALSEWARFVVSAAEFFDYASQDLECCRRLLSYIWQIPYGSGLPARAVTLATVVRNWPRRAA